MALLSLSKAVLIFAVLGGMDMRYGYARVSTRLQAIHGNSLDEQVEQLQNRGCEKVITEQYTGSTVQRPLLEQLLAKLHAGDTLVVTKLDRLARTAAEGSKMISELLEQGINVHVLNIGLIDNTPTGRLLANVLLAFAEFERDLIMERTLAGKAYARTKTGYREGRPPIPAAQKQHAVNLILAGEPYKQVMDETGLSRSTISRAVRQYRFENP